MKKITKVVCLVLTMLVIMNMMNTQELVAQAKTNIYAKNLSGLGILKGSDKGYELDREPSRLEGLVMFIRLIGKEDEVVNYDVVDFKFKDVPEWGEKYVQYAYDHGYVKGVSEDTFGSDQNMDLKSYLTLVLRALGYDDSKGDFQWDAAIATAVELGIIDEDNQMVTQEFTRGHVAEVSYKALQIEVKGEKKSLKDVLVETGGISEQDVHELNDFSDQETAPAAVSLSSLSPQPLPQNFTQPEQNEVITIMPDKVETALVITPAPIAVAPSEPVAEEPVVEEPVVEEEVVEEPVVEEPVVEEEVVEEPVVEEPAILNIYDFGAAGNGITDDSFAFEAAISQADVQDVILLVPEGDYRFASSVGISGSDYSIKLEEGAVLSGDNLGSIAVLNIADADNVRIYGDGTVESDFSGWLNDKTNGVISIKNSSRVTVEGLLIRNANHAGVSMMNSGDCTLKFNTISNAVTGIYDAAGNNNTVIANKVVRDEPARDPYVDGNDRGIRGNETTDLMIKDNVVENYSIGIEMYHSTNGVIIQKNDILETGFGINLDRAHNSIVTGNRIIAGDIIVPFRSSISESGGTNVTIEDNYVQEPAVIEPIVEEPIVEEPIVEEPIVEEPIAEEPIVEEPIAEEPMITARTLNVYDFGAVGNGTADDTSAFESAIRAADEMDTLLYVPAGNYNFFSTVDINGSGYEIEIAKGAVLSGNSLGYRAVLNVSNADHLIIFGEGTVQSDFSGLYADKTNGIISVKNSSNIVVDGLTIQNANHAGISMLASSHVTVENNKILNAVTAVFDSNGDSNSVINNVIARDAAARDACSDGLDRGVRGNETTDLLIRGNLIRNFSLGIEMYRDTNRVVIDNNDIVGTAFAMSLDRGHYSIVTDNRIVVDDINLPFFIGIELAESNHVTIDSNYIKITTGRQSGVGITAWTAETGTGKSSDGVVMTNNYVEGVNSGIILSGSTNATVKSNEVTNVNYGVEMGQYNGYNITIDNNMITNQSINGVLLPGNRGFNHVYITNNYIDDIGRLPIETRQAVDENGEIWSANLDIIVSGNQIGH